MRQLNSDLIFGVLCLLAGLAVAFIWAPLDTDTGLIERVRGRNMIGDAMAPTAAGALMAIGGLLLCLQAMRRASSAALSIENFKFALTLLIVFAISLALMRWSGPIVVNAAQAFGADWPDYRELRDTTPFKHLGYLIGGTFLVSTLIAWIDRRLTFRAVVLGLMAALLMAMAYDGPFDNLLLPPNGDV